MKFIHCADLHLNSKMDGISSEKAKIRRYETLETFERLCAYAKKNAVKAVIIAGDMFDMENVPIKVINHVFFAIKECPETDFIYISGNHDETVLKEIEYLPNNFKIISDRWEKFSYGNVDISGISINKKNSGLFYDSLFLDKDRINIVTMHGEVAGYNAKEDAEVISIPKLKDKYIDYLALGHYHTFTEGKIDERGKFAYSGCLDGRGFDETGDKGFVLLETDERHVYSSFIKFASRTLYEYEFSVSEYDNFAALKKALTTSLENDVEKTSLIKIVLKGERNAYLDIDKQGLELYLNSVYFFVKVYDKTEIKIDINDFAQDKTLRGEFLREVLKSDMDNLTKSRVITCGINALKGEDF